MAIPVPIYIATPVSVDVSPVAARFSVEVIVLLFETVTLGCFVVSVVGCFAKCVAASGKQVHFEY